MCAARFDIVADDTGQSAQASSKPANTSCEHAQPSDATQAASQPAQAIGENAQPLAAQAVGYFAQASSLLKPEDGKPLPECMPKVCINT